MCLSQTRFFEKKYEKNLPGSGDLINISKLGHKVTWPLSANHNSGRSHMTYIWLYKGAELLISSLLSVESTWLNQNPQKDPLWDLKSLVGRPLSKSILRGPSLRSGISWWILLVWSPTWPLLGGGSKLPQPETSCLMSTEKRSSENGPFFKGHLSIKN